MPKIKYENDYSNEELAEMLHGKYCESCRNRGEGPGCGFYTKSWEETRIKTFPPKWEWRNKANRLIEFAKKYDIPVRPLIYFILHLDL